MIEQGIPEITLLEIEDEELARMGWERSILFEHSRKYAHVRGRIWARARKEYEWLTPDFLSKLYPFDPSTIRSAIKNVRP